MPARDCYAVNALIGAGLQEAFFGQARPRRILTLSRSFQAARDLIQFAPANKVDPSHWWVRLDHGCRPKSSRKPSGLRGPHAPSIVRAGTSRFPCSAHLDITSRRAADRLPRL